MWLYEDMLYPQIGLNAVSGRPKDQWNTEPARFDEMRKGCWDIDARVADMDLDGVWASLCFPSLLAGFAGVVFSQSKDQDLGLALHAGVERLAHRRLGRHAPASGSSRCRSRGSPIRRSRRTRSGRTRPAGSRR